jgi:hypothetical protein
MALVENDLGNVVDICFAWRGNGPAGLHALGGRGSRAARWARRESLGGRTMRKWAWFACVGRAREQSCALGLTWEPGRQNRAPSEVWTSTLSSYIVVEIW